MDCIIINELEVYSNHGVYKEENVLGQKFMVSIKLYTDTQNAGISDSIEDSIHYGDVCQYVTSFMKAHTYNLLEAVAQDLCVELLNKYETLEKIWLQIKKPWAPIGLPINSVGVEVERSYHTVYLSMGSNMGDKKAYLDSAIDYIRNNKNCRVEKVSSYIETKPYGFKEQEDFLNACIKIKTILSPYCLLELLHSIETSAKRVREIHWGPRTLDLDILLYDDIIMSEEDLVIPHPDMLNRDFVMNPLCEIAPNAVHPLENKRISDLC